jgi:methyl-accepting chemotaxis protein
MLGDPPDAVRRSLPFGFHLVAGVAALLALLAASIAIAIFLVFSLKREQEQLQDRNVPFALAVATAAHNAKGIANDERGFLLSGNPEFLDEIDQRLISARAAFAEATSAAEGDVQLAAVSEARAGFERWVAALRAELRAFQRGNRGNALDDALGRGRALRKQYEASLARAEAVATGTIQVRRSAIGSEWSRAVTILVGGFVVALVIGLGIAFWLTRMILRPVYELVELVAQAVETPEPAPGELRVPAPPVDDLQQRN